MYQCRKAFRRNMAVNCSLTRLNISWMAVELPTNVAAILRPLGGMSQMDDLTLLGIHSTKYDEFLFCTFSNCSSTCTGRHAARSAAHYRHHLRIEPTSTKTQTVACVLVSRHASWQHRRPIMAHPGKCCAAMLPDVLGVWWWHVPGESCYQACAGDSSTSVEDMRPRKSAEAVRVWDP